MATGGKFRAKKIVDTTLRGKANEPVHKYAVVGNGDGATYLVASKASGTWFWIRLVDDNNRLTQCRSPVPLSYGDEIYVKESSDRKLRYYMFDEFIQDAGAGTDTPIPDHDHSAAGGEGGQLDWDDIWTDAVHTHANAAEGGQLDWDNIWTDAVHDHSSNAEGGQDLRQINEFEFDDATILTIDGAGSVTRTQVYHIIAANAGVADNLDNVAGGVEGDELVIWPDTGDTITVRHNQGGAGDFWFAGGANITLDNEDHLRCICNANGRWCDQSGGAGGGAHNILSATHTDSAAAACVVGDVITGQAGPAWARVAVGAQGAFFKAVAGTTPSWVHISAQTVTVGPGTTCDYATLGAACADFGVGLASPTAANPWVVKIFGGVYAEAGNITVPAYCWIEGEEDGVQINMGTNQDITFSANSGMENAYVYGNPTSYLLGTTADGVIWRNIHAHLTSAGADTGFYAASGSQGAVTMVHCTADNGNYGFYVGSTAIAYMHDCHAYNNTIGFGLANTAVADTLFCDFTNNTYDVNISAGTAWNHFHCRSLRNSIAADPIYSGYTHWPNGQYLDMDFTGVMWNTKAECNYVGLRFSDTATPFPTTFLWPVSGSWAHSAGNGWAPTFTTNSEGPVILVPLIRPPNWELDIDFEFTPSDVNQRFGLVIGYITNSNHVGAYGLVRDNNVAASELQYFLSTNDGDDTYTTQYTGAVIAGATGNYEIRFRAQNGCVGVYDDQNNSWNYYAGRQNAGHGYTAAHAFLQFYRVDTNVPTLRVRNLTLTYLL